MSLEKSIQKKFEELDRDDFETAIEEWLKVESKLFKKYGLEKTLELYDWYIDPIVTGADPEHKYIANHDIVVKGIEKRYADMIAKEEKKEANAEKRMQQAIKKFGTLEAYEEDKEKKKEARKKVQREENKKNRNMENEYLKHDFLASNGNTIKKWTIPTNRKEVEEIADKINEGEFGGKMHQHITTETKSGSITGTANKKTVKLPVYIGKITFSKKEIKQRKRQNFLDKFTEYE